MPMNNLPQLQRFSRSASLISPQYASDVLALASEPERNDALAQSLPDRMAGLHGTSNMRESSKPFPFVGGVAVIPVYGALLHRDRWCSSYATGYDFIAAMHAMAVSDPDVRGIAFDLNSYGGHVAGNFELAQAIYDARSAKPSIAIVDSRALSGGYSIASACGKIVATPSADIGSIGVVLMHMSVEKALEEAGVKVTYIFSGKHKVDGNPYEDLPDDVRAALQAGVKKSYDSFVALVARNRSMSADSVRETEARVYDADEAKALGLVDDVMSPGEAFAAFLQEVTTSTKAKGTKMSNENAAPKVEGGDAAALQTAAADARTAEKARVSEILACDEAKERPALASHIALHTDMSAADAKAMLAKAAVETKPKEEAAAPAAPTKGPLATAMDDQGGPNVGADDGSKEGDGTDKSKSRMERIIENSRKVSGVNHTTH